MVGMDELGGNLAARRVPRDRQVFRSPAAAAVWWVWLLFAVANLIDIAVQGRDHLSVVAAGTLLVVTGVVYVAAERPKIVADDDGLTIVNPFRDHRVSWAAVAGYDTTDLLRVRCVWTTAASTGNETGSGEAGGESRRAIYSWALHSSRRRAIANELRAQTRGQRRSISGGGSFGGSGSFGGRGPFGGYGPPPDNAPPPKPLGLDADIVVGALTAQADKAKARAPEVAAGPPVSAWSWSAIAAVLIPAILLLIVALV
jgi:Bacterial PH domain